MRKGNECEGPCGEVAAAIEQVMVAIAKNILDGEGFGYSLPSRGGNDQLYLEQLDRIVLKVGWRNLTPGFRS